MRPSAARGLINRPRDPRLGNRLRESLSNQQRLEGHRRQSCHPTHSPLSNQALEDDGELDQVGLGSGMAE